MRFADTSFWYAIQDERDRHHADAVALVNAGLGNVLVSSNVVGETWTMLRRRQGHRIAINFIDGLNRIPRLEVVHIGEGLEREAWTWLRRHDERPYSFIDATSFAVMRRRRIREALAFDADFAAAGFVEVRPG